MKTNNWTLVESIYDRAVELDQNKQESFVEESAKGDKDVVSQVMKMLESKQQDFMGEFPGKVTLENTNISQLESLAHFKIIKKIATGGMGRVYLAQSTIADVPIKVALKTIRIELINDELKRKFKNEKTILSKLHHKNIASLIDAGVTDNQIPYIATEWVNGKNIKDYCIDNNLSIKQRLKLFLQICDAMTFAHNKLVIHRDLKPDNILVNEQKQVKLLDFGIAKIVDENQNQQTQTQIFTPDYAAPEQLSGKMCTAATDIYSLGIILFEMLTNSKRFNLAGLAIAEKIKAIAIPKLADLSDIQPDHKLNYSVSNLKGALYTIINKAMHVEPNRRYDSVSSLVFDIENYLENRPIKAMNDSVLYKTKMLIKRNKLASSFLTLAFMSSFTGWYVSNSQFKLKRQEAEKSQVILEFFHSTLQAASPNQGGKINISVMDMFEVGINKYNLNAIKDPYIKSELAAQIGVIYRQLGERRKAIEYTSIGVDYNRQNLPNNADSFLEYTNRIITILIEDENFNGALNKLNLAIDLTKGSKVDEINVCITHLQLAKIYGGLNKFEQSKENFDMAERIAEKNRFYNELGEINYSRTHALNSVLNHQQLSSYLDKAQLNYEKSLNGKYNPNLIKVMSGRSRILFQQGQLIASNELNIKTSKLITDIFGKDNPAHLINSVGVLHKLGRFNQAIEKLKLAESLTPDFGEVKNTNYYGTTLMKATYLVELKKFKQAKVFLDDAKNHFNNLQPRHQGSIIFVTLRYADLYLKSANSKQLKIIKSVLEGYIESNDENKSLSKGRAASIYAVLGNIGLYFEDYESAENYFYKALSLKGIYSIKQSWTYWQIETGYQLSRIKLGDFKGLDKFKAAKKQLLDIVSEDDWFDSFFSIDKNS